MIYFDFFDHFWSISIRTQFFWFGRAQLKSRFKFGLKKSIESWYHHNIRQFVYLDGLDRLSLQSYLSFEQDWSTPVLRFIPSLQQRDKTLNCVCFDLENVFFMTGTPIKTKYRGKKLSINVKKTKFFVFFWHQNI